MSESTEIELPAVRLDREILEKRDRARREFGYYCVYTNRHADQLVDRQVSGDFQTFYKELMLTPGHHRLMDEKHHPKLALLGASPC